MNTHGGLVPPNYPYRNMHNTDKIYVYRYMYLLHDRQSAEWFGEDGNLLALPDPMNDSVLRPVIPEQITERALQTEFKQVHVHVV